MEAAVEVGVFDTVACVTHGGAVARGGEASGETCLGSTPEESSVSFDSGTAMAFFFCKAANRRSRRSRSVSKRLMAVSLPKTKRSEGEKNMNKRTPPELLSKVVVVAVAR